MSTVNLYETLGISRSATTAEIKRAYRKLAKKYHPDHNPDDSNAERMFKEVQHAYSVLSDEKKRAQYDRFGEIGVGDFQTGPAGQRVYSWGTEGSSHLNAEDLDGLFEMFGGEQSTTSSPFSSFFRQTGASQRRRRQRPQSLRGQDVRQRISLAFEQAVKGCMIEVDIQPNNANRGQGETLDVKIPPGVEDGQQIRLNRKGMPGIGGGPAGDLYLTCSVRPHKYFRREEHDIHLDVPLTITEAALGTKIGIPTLDGTVMLTIPSGTSSGSKLRLKGRGVPRRGSKPAGDQYVVIRVVVPNTLTREQKEHLEALAATLDENPREAFEGS